MKTRDKWPNTCCELRGEDGGMFRIPCEGRVLLVIVSNGAGWDHASVSLPNRCPNWREMCYIKDLFWSDDEVVIQYHPAKDQYVNNHKHCLHMWKPQDVEVPIPPKIMVGF